MSSIVIRLGRSEEAPSLIEFFNRNIAPDCDALNSEELLCPFGIKGALRRGEIIVATDNGKIIASLRFYIRKRTQTVSLYQFAVDASYRGKGLIFEMLQSLRNKDIVSICPCTSAFNTYYEKAGWIKSETNEETITWSLKAPIYLTRAV